MQWRTALSVLNFRMPISSISFQKPILITKIIIKSISLQGDVGAYLKKRGALKLTTAIKFALDIARLEFRQL